MSTRPSPRRSVAAWPTTPRRSATGSAAIGLIVIGLAGQDLVRPEDLLHQHHPGELMGQRHGAERQLEVAALQLQPLGPADDEADVATLLAPLLEPAAEAERVVALALTRQEDDVGPVGDAR